MSITRNNRTSALASILFFVVIWGSGSTVTKLGVQEMPPSLFALLRNPVTSLLLLLLFASGPAHTLRKQIQGEGNTAKNIIIFYHFA